MKKLSSLRAMLLGLAVALAVSGLSAPAHAQMPTLVGSAESAAVGDGIVPGWYRRVGEGPFSPRDPLSSLYFIVGGHAGFSTSTRLDDVDGCEQSRSFFLDCANRRPSDSPGTGGGGSVGIGTRLTPALRVALLFTGETGYRFENDKPWVDEGSGETFVEKVSIHSFQGTMNAYVDVAGFFRPGALGGFNPYFMAGGGMAVNVTGEMKETDTLGNATVTNTYPGTTQESLVWTVGVGLQYRILPGVVADLSYQYVDAGRFRAAGTGQQQISGATGTAFVPPFRSIHGDLETHRVGLAVNVELEAIRRWFGGR